MDTYRNDPLGKLEELEQQWELKDESEEEPDFRQEWVKEGIEIYEALIRKRVSDEQKSIYYRNLASLYLEFGRSEKMIEGNTHRAFRNLQKAAHYLPEKGDTFYHLAFLAGAMTRGSEKWESAAFYIKEALERGIAKEKQIKAWCLLGKAYLELGFEKNAATCFERSKELDQDDEFVLFRTKYSRSEREKADFVRLNQGDKRMNKRLVRAEWIERSMQGECFVLELTHRRITLYGNGTSVGLNSREGELLRLFFENDEGLTKYEISNNTVDSMDDKKANAVKTYIHRLRATLQKGLGVNGKELIQVVGERPDKKYMWNRKVEKHLIEE